MLYSEILTEVRDQCRIPTGSTKDTFIRRQINLASDEMSRFRPWWFMETRLTLTLVAGNYISLPTRFTCMDWRSMKSSAGPIDFWDFSKVEQQDPTLGQSGTPTVFGFVGRSWFFWPSLTAAFIAANSISCRHFQTLKHVNTSGTATGDGSDFGDTDTPEPTLDLHESLVLGAGYRCLRFDGIARWVQVKQDFIASMKDSFARGPTIGGPGAMQDNAFSYIVGM